MSQTVDNRVVEMQFDNKDFEQHAQESLKTLQELKESMKFDDAAKNLQDLNKSANQVDFSTISDSINNLADKFSTLRLLGIHALGNIVDAAMTAGKKIFSALNAPIAQAKAGGWARAANLENAKFQMQGILGTTEKVAQAMDSVDKAVTGTAYSLDEAAKVASQLIASGVQLGDTLTTSLRSIAGVAAQTNSSFGDIGNIFATVKGQGKLMTMQLRQLESRGLNAAATVADYMTEVGKGTKEASEDVKSAVADITNNMAISEASVREMVTKGKISFELFSQAMTDAFGENAAKANETFDGALANMKSALNRIGAEFATPLRQNMIPVLNQVRLFINAIKGSLGGVFDAASTIMGFLSKLAVNRLAKLTSILTNNFTAMDSIGRAIKITFVNLVRIFKVIGQAFSEVFPSNGGTIGAINKMGDGLERLSLRLYMSDEALLKLRNGVKIFLTIIKGVFTVISKIVSVAWTAIKVILRVVGLLAALVIEVGRFVSGLFKVGKNEDKVTKSTEKLGKKVNVLEVIFEKLRGVLSTIYPVLQTIGNGIKTAVTVIAGVVGGTLYLAFEKIKDIIGSFKNVNPFEFLKLKVTEFSLKIQEFIDKLKQIPVIGIFVNYLEKFFIQLGHAIKNAITFFKELFESIRNGEFTLETLKEKLMLIPAAFEIIKEKIMGFFGGSDGMTGIMDTIKEKLLGAGEAIKSFASKVKESLHDINVGRVLLLIFSVAVVALTLNIFHLVTNLNYFLQSATGLVKTIKSLFTSKWSSILNSTAAKITAVGVAITALAEALIELSQVPKEDLTKAAIALGSITVAVAGFAAVATIVQSVTKVTGGFNAFTANMLVFSAGIAALVGALWLLQYVDLTNMKKKLLILGALGTGLAVLSALMGKIAPSLTKGSFFMIAFAGSIYLLVEAVARLAEIDLTAVQGSWKELLAILAGLGVVVKIASGLGLVSLAGLVGFILMLKFIFKNLDEIKQLNGGEILQKVVDKLRDIMHEVSIKIDEIVTFMKDTVKKILELPQDEFDRIMHLGVFIASVVIALSFAFSSFSHLLKALTGATIAVAALILLSRLVAQWMEESPNMKEAMRYVGSFILLVGVFEILVGIANRIGGAGTVKASAKVFSSIGFLLLSMAAVALVTKDLTPEEFNRLHQLLIDAIGIISVVQVIISVVNAFARGTPAGLLTFVGMILMFATMMGSMVILMQMLRDEEDYIKLGTAIVAMAAVCILIGYTIQSLRSIKTGNILAIFGGIIALFVALGAVAVALDYFKTDPADIITRLSAISLILLELIVLMGVMAIVKHFIRPATLLSMVESLTLLMGVFVAIGFLGAVLDFTGVGADSLFLKLSAISLVIGELIGLMFLLKLLHDKITPGELKKMEKLLGGIVGMFAVIAIIGGALVLLPIDGLELISKLSSINLILFELIGLMFTLKLLHDKLKPAELTKMIKSLSIMVGLFAAIALVIGLLDAFHVEGIVEKGSSINLVLFELIGLMFTLTLIKDKAKDLGKAEKALLGMVGLFAAVSIVFWWINSFYTEGLLGKVEAVVLVLTELIVLTGVVSVLGPIWTQALKGEVALVAMIALFAIITLIFMWINSFYTEGLLGKVEAIILVLLELEALTAIAAALGLIMPEALLGEITLVAMVGIFAILAQVFKVISGLNPEGLLGKSQAIILVLLELEGLAAICGALGLILPMILMGEVALVAMVGIFAILAQVFKVINELETEGLLQKSQAMILVLLELEGLCAILGAIAPLALAALAGIPAMIGIAYAMQEIATALSMVSTMEVGDLQGRLSIFINALNGLIEIGIKGIAAGPGLTLLSGGITALGIACGFAAPHFEAVASSITSLATALPQLSGSIDTLGNSVVTALVNMANTVSTTLHKIASDILETLNYSIENIIPAVYRVSYGLGAAIVLGFRDGAEWHSPPRFVLEFFQDFTSAFTSMAGRVGNTIRAVAQYLGSFFEPGLRDGLQWHSDPVPCQEFAKDFGNFWKKLGSGGFGLASILPNAAKSITSLFGNKLHEGNLEIMDMLSGDLSSIMQQYNQIKYATELEGLATRERNINYKRSHLRDDYRDRRMSTEEFQKSLTELNVEMASVQKQEKDLLNGTADLSLKFGDFGQIIDEDVIPPVTNLGGAAGKTKDELAELAQSLEDTLTGQMNIFDKFEKKDPMNPDQMIENMTSQITGMTEWATDMNKLATMGIDQGLLQKLAELGPEGADKVKAFVNMSADQLAQANTLWAQSLALPKQVTDMLMYDMQVAGANATVGLANGIAAESAKPVAETTEVVEDVKEAVEGPEGLDEHSPSKFMIKCGENAMFGLRNGIRNYQHEVFNAINFVIQHVKGLCEIGLASDKFTQYGINVIDGITKGVKDDAAMARLSEAVSSAAKLTEKTFTSKKKGIDSDSPSKLFAKLGGYIPWGIAVGIEDNAYRIIDAIGEIRDPAMDAMRNAISGVAKMVEEDVEDPVITPVLDLSNVISGARTLNSLFSTNQALAVAGSMNDSQNGKFIGGTTFIQNNYSPKALTRADIYRQTRNQFAQYRQATL